ncbi:hypothetical protein FZI85_07365 [Mycobacterium sp. CBMA293]|uniref:hypothetical protein n=1 Tax=unclassified Mycolicibacterium TaxID=2636767 RepID=UPI0012DE4BDB|nr:MULTISPECIES: hypothetical protein [unclassified Mycolicibacterium]MUL45390.1 hypothetical protein [Mycolicibacterium sp. CBMA 360]MUL56909.1 hypothetical protein [Mycolicibacterium sp. CBMA 335]MUL69949.1 hypothetical protein [Mycolicibacterium sp. CBMA 311]MUL91997.1 hypothetical protein [Mycolicibacterium sp. CBMA 230]MUM05735.1 hypothetical protein [Mycolicibacterium sp. CBMA 213]
MADKPKRYKMFRTTFVKFPGRKANTRAFPGVSHITLESVSRSNYRFSTSHRQLSATRRPEAARACRTKTPSYANFGALSPANVVQA